MNVSGGVRSNALWGRRGGEQRRSRSGRLAAALAVMALAVPLGAAAGQPAAAPKGPVVQQQLLDQARANPNAVLSVIVQGKGSVKSVGVANKILSVTGTHPGTPRIKRQFLTISGVSADVTGAQLLTLARDPSLASITADSRVRLDGYASNQQWPYQAELSKFWDRIQNTGLQAPTVAVVDSGVDTTRTDFGGRVIKQVTMTSLVPNAPGDGRGHGTFVAGVLAGSAAGYAGGAPNAKVVSLDVMDDNGMAMTSDVIAAADWIYRNKDAYGIRIANFSLHNSVANSFMYDPLDKAVEKLWFSGVVVVASAGNYGTGTGPSGVLYAPGNDPFVITAGAADIEGTITSSDDVAAPWSAYGYTLDGFMKPDVGAPGRYMIGPVPTLSTLTTERPGSVTCPGYMQLSGTSFSAPVVAAAAAYALARNPSFTPDQVKGALMVGAVAPPGAAANSLGVGEVKADKAAAVTSPPNPNLALSKYVVSDPAGGSGRVFDAASWANTAKADASWNSASWASASWSSASWNTASWANASWSSASWASASWAATSVATSTTDASWADRAKGDIGPLSGYRMSFADYLALGLTPPK
jgi:subtilisin family serine protease